MLQKKRALEIKVFKPGAGICSKAVSFKGL